MEAKEEIRSRLNIEDVIGEYVQLRRAGRNFKGFSPFSNEKTPSFMVSPEKHIWHDFSSNKGGDIFSFIMEVEGIEFRAAMELLARKAGVDLSKFEQKGDRGLSQKKERLYKLLTLAVNFYQHMLIKNQAALGYVFKKRGLSKQIVQQFGIGYAPNADTALLQFLLQKGYKEADVREAGLVTTRRGRPTDMFRGRMMVPLADGQGRTVGFTARLIDDQPNAPKYINTAQTLLYDKGRQVFGLHLAKEAIRKRDYAVIVEGNLDVVASHQAGVPQVVATAGTAMTEFHLRSLSRLTGNIRLAFDQDSAGIAATERAIGIASKLGLQLGIVSVPEGYKDPDELIQADPNAWLGAIEQPQDAVEWLIDIYAKRFDLNTAEGKRHTTTKALEIIGQLLDPVEQEHYLSVLAGRTNTSLDAVKDKLAKTAEPQQAQRTRKVIAKRVVTPDPHLQEDHLLALTLVYPSLRDTLLKLSAEDFTGGMRQTVFTLIKKLGLRPVDDTVLEKLQSDDLCVKIKELQLVVEQKYNQLEDTLYFVASELSKELARATDQAERQAKNTAYKRLIQEIEELKR
jgi:DNA primase